MRRHRFGFTLIELLMVVVVIGLLTAIAVPALNTVKGRARAAAIKGDLKNLATSQELYWSENGVYTNAVGSLRWAPSPGVVATITEVNGGEGWSATTTHPLSLPLICAVFFGKAAPVHPATVEGLITCM